MNPSRWFARFPQRIRTYLLLFALALTLPVLSIAIFALDQMASAEQAEIERRVLLVAQNVAADVDRELDRAFAVLETLQRLVDWNAGI